MNDKVREFGDKLKLNGGVGLFYYAGHGIQVNSRNYLIPVEAEIPREDEVDFNALNLDLVLRKMATANNGLNIVVLDACRNNPFARNWSRGEEEGGLAQISAPTGTFIAYATSPDKTASDGTGRNGLYTAELLKFITKPNLKIEDAFKQVTIAVDRTSGGKQVPWTSSSLRGEFYFKQIEQKSNVVKPITTDEKEPMIVAKDKAAQESEAWDLVKNSTSASDFRYYLEEFPDGANAAKAKIRLEELVWQSVRGADKAKIQAYLNEFPNGANASAARIRLPQLEAASTPTTTPTNNNSQKSKTDKTKGSFTGKVVDSQSGFAISGAIVQFINQRKNNHTTAVRTDSEGTIFSTALSPGIYLIKISHQGYKSFTESQELFATRINAIIPVPIKLERLTTLDETKPTTTNTTNTTAGAISKSNLPNGVEMSFAYIPAGEFQMGSTQKDNKKRVHTVKISQGFFMGQTEVTQAQWKAIMGALPSECEGGSLSGEFLGDNKPLICVSWDDAQEFIKQMNSKNDGYKYRLPTEAEWEYAARSGTTGDYAGNLDSMAWYGANSGSKTHDVATTQANAWSLFDMHGNVMEWCQDWHGDYPSGTVTNPIGATSGSYRVLRGGSWNGDAVNLRSAYRNSGSPSVRSGSLGFRLVRN